jgi:predicted nucleotidyltransferase
MRILGVVAEYNPFHSGHEYQLKRARALSGCDYAVAVMGGAFSQRGEPMLIDKQARARMALGCGVDLVVELPALFAIRPAEVFATAGVAILGALGAGSISFGCETDDIALLSELAELREREPPELAEAIAENLSRGMSHPRSRHEALIAYMGSGAASAAGPNAALAVEYIRANNKLANPMTAYPVLRTAGHHDQQLGKYAGAGAIRAALWRGGFAGAASAMPESAAAVLKECWPDRAADPRAIDILLLYRLRGMSYEEIAALPDVSEGLERRVYGAARVASGREELLTKAKCKRYTRARLSRLCAHALLGMTGRMARDVPAPAYIRALGFRQSAEPLLKFIKNNASLPFITGPAALKNNQCFQLENRATDMQGLCMRDANMRKSGRDYSEKIMII